jgi:hypothetical protein
MKKSSFFFFFLVWSFTLFAQVEDPVSWTFTAKKITGNQYEVHMKASVEGNWHIYAQECGKGPEPTSFTFSKNPLITLKGKTAEIGKLESNYDPNFKSTLKYYNKQVDFVQKITKKTKASTTLKGTVTFMVCNERKCLPPKDVPFAIKID